MDVLVAAWSARLALVAALAVGALSVSAGVSPLDAVTRAAAAAFVFTLAGRVLMSRLETPDQRVRRLRARRAVLKQAADERTARTRAA
jgi:membrane protein implicated in regulation of membrane protease activity